MCRVSELTRHPTDKRIAVIIPAYNEEGRIGAVLEVARRSPIVSDIVVVSDGSSDRTGEIAAAFDVNVCTLPKNVGKGGAMLRGALCANDADILIFLDADLVGLKPEHIEALAAPLISERSAMAIGQFVGGRGVTDLAQSLVKCISGQRAIGRDLFLSIPAVDTVGYGVEMLITLHVSYLNLRTEVVTLNGVTHPMKEEKLGFLRGAAARARMYWQMGRFWGTYHFSGHPPKSPVSELMHMSEKGNVVISNGSSQDKAVDPIQNAPVTR